MELKTLEEKWLRLCAAPWNQPTEDIKDYFGEKIALYFLWLGHYTSWLLGACFVSVIAYISVAGRECGVRSVRKVEGVGRVSM